LPQLDPLQEPAAAEERSPVDGLSLDPAGAGADALALPDVHFHVVRHSVSKTTVAEEHEVSRSQRGAWDVR
jgi:hypothetical protein